MACTMENIFNKEKRIWMYPNQRCFEGDTMQQTNEQTNKLEKSWWPHVKPSSNHWKRRTRELNRTKIYNDINRPHETWIHCCLIYLMYRVLKSQMPILRTEFLVLFLVCQQWVRRKLPNRFTHSLHYLTIVLYIIYHTLLYGTTTMLL